MIKSDELIRTHDPAPARRHRWSRALGFLALITCPCHVPLLALALSGTAALAAHFDKAVMLFSVLFLLSLCAAIWVWRGKGFDGQHGSVAYEVQPRALFAVSIWYVSNGSPFRGM